MNAKSFFIFLFVSVILLVILVPFFDLPDLKNSKINGNLILFYIAISGIFIYMCAIHSLCNYMFYKISIVDLLLLLFVLWNVFNSIFIQENSNISFQIYELIGLIFFYVIIRNSKFNWLIYIALGLIFSGIIQSIIGNLQLYGFYWSKNPDFKLTGTFFNPGPYAGYLVSIAPIAISFYFFDLNKVLSKYPNKTFFWNNRIMIIPIAIIVAIIPATLSRASWLALLISVFFILNKKFSLFMYFRKKILLFLISSILLLFVFFKIYNIKKASVEGRFLIWEVTLSIIKSNPICGVGYDRFQFAYMNFQADFFRNNPEVKASNYADNVTSAFNEFLEIGSETGVIGITIIFLILFFSLSNKFNHSSSEIIWAKAGLISIITFSFFSYPFNILPIKINLIIYLAALAKNSKLSFNIFHSLFLFRNKYYFNFIKLTTFLLVCSIIFLSLLYFNNVYVGLKKWKKADDLFQVGLYSKSISVYREIVPLFSNEGEFLMNYGQVLAMGRKCNEAIEILLTAKKHFNNSKIQISLGNCYVALNKFHEAELTYLDAWYMIPNRFYPKYLLMKLYIINNNKKKAFETAQYILNKSAKVNSTAIREMRDEVKKYLNDNKLN